jgi:SPASM domain peptide maturase of grasp-with-spasm system
MKGMEEFVPVIKQIPTLSILTLMKIDNKKHFLLFTNCILVKGYKESIIMDIQRNSFLPVSNLLFDVLSLNLKTLTVGELKNQFHGQYNKGIDKFLIYLVEEEYGFFTNETLYFPDLSKDFYSPYAIVSSVINYSSKSGYNLESVFNQLTKLSCQLIQLRLFDKIDLDLIAGIINVVKSSRLNLLEIYIQDYNYSTVDLLQIIESDFRITLIVYSSERTLELPGNPYSDRLFFIREEITPISKEIIDLQMFVSNIEFYVESLKYNVGLNRKTCIDMDGSIKNFVNHSMVFGNVMKDTLESIINKKEFKEQWYICNDMIEKCKDCQYRYMCLSNSAVEYRDNRYYKLDTCSFNPTTNTWNRK